MRNIRNSVDGLNNLFDTAKRKLMKWKTELKARMQHKECRM